MIRLRITALGLLCLGLCGCGEMMSTDSAKERTGAVGVTSQDIDDLAKPASAAKDAAP